jgi:hypothetical protein
MDDIPLLLEAADRSLVILENAESPVIVNAIVSLQVNLMAVRKVGIVVQVEVAYRDIEVWRNGPRKIRIDLPELPFAEDR